jgi:hypothetical protein
MSYEEKLEYEYCMALKQKLSMNNKLYAACYGLINSIPFLPEMNNLTYSLLMDKKDPKVYADSPEGRLKNALKARELHGDTVTADTIKEFKLYNEDLMAWRRRGLIQPADRCPNCKYFTRGIQTINHD